MRRFLILILLLLLLTGQAAAVELADAFGASELQRGLPPAAEELLGDISPTEQPDLWKLEDIFTDAWEKSRGFFHAALKSMFRVLLIVILCRLAELGDGEQIGRATAMAGAFAITLCCAEDMKSLIGLGSSTMDEVMAFSDLLLPVMASAAAACGAVGKASAIYAVTTVFSNLLIRFCNSILIPAVYGVIALGLCDCALQENRLKKAGELIAWFIRFCLKTIMYAFTGFLAVTGVISGTSDAVALKAAKVTISSMVPVVGGIISDAADTVLAGAGVLKSAVGTFGMLAIVAVFLLPFLRMGFQFLSFKLASALGGMMGSKLGGLLDTLAEAMGFMLAMTGSCVMMCLLSCICFMRMVQP